MPYSNKNDQRAAWRRHYQNNKEIYLERNKKLKESNKEFLRELKERTPCYDCKQSYPFYVMDFDHIDPSIKFENVSKLINRSRKLLETEIAKCEIVCSNCHRIRTYKRSGIA